MKGQKRNHPDKRSNRGERGSGRMVNITEKRTRAGVRKGTSARDRSQETGV